MSLNDIHIDSDSFNNLDSLVHKCLGLENPKHKLMCRGITNHGIKYCKIAKYYSNFSKRERYCPFQDIPPVEVKPIGVKHFTQYYFVCMYEMWLKAKK